MSNPRARVLKAGLVALVLAAAQLNPAGAADLPPARKILARYVEVTGGEAVYRKFKFRTIKGIFSLAAMGVQAPVIMLAAAPNLARMEVEITGLGKIESGFDGTTAWETNPMTGPRILEGSEALTAAHDAVFNAELEWKKLYQAVETVGREEIDGRQTYVVKLTPAEGPVETRYYGVDDGLLVRVSRTLPTEMGEVPVEITFSDYQTFDGLRLATKVRQKVSVQEIEVTVTSIDHTTPLPASMFAPPAAVEALRGQPATDPAPPAGK